MNMVMAVILLSKWEHFTFPCSQFLVFQPGPKLCKVDRRVYANMVKRFVLRFSMLAAADTSQRGVNSCYQIHHDIIVTDVIFDLNAKWPPRVLSLYSHL